MKKIILWGVSHLISNALERVFLERADYSCYLILAPDVISGKNDVFRSDDGKHLNNVLKLSA